MRRLEAELSTAYEVGALRATDEGGDSVADRPVTTEDLFQSFYKGLKIRASKENMAPIGRPIKIVDGGKAVTELL